MVSPPWIVPFLVVNYLMYRGAWKGVPAELRAGTAVPGGIVLTAVLHLVVLSCLTGHGTVTLDRQSNTVVVRRLYPLWIPVTHRFSLAEVAKAGVLEAPHSNLFYVQTIAGDRYHIDWWDQTGGQWKAANAVNAFLAQPAGGQQANAQ